MSVENVAPVGGEGAVAPVVVDTPADTSPITAREAAAALSRARWEKQKAAPEEVEQPQEELADEADNDAQPPADPVETTEQQPEPEESLPPIEPPRSWTKDEKERFQSLPRETQEYIASREQDRERAIRQSQNEAAEKLKGLTAKEQEVEQVRQQYESALPILLQTLQQTQAGEFSDIRTMADVEKMAAEDWPRYVRWDAQQKKIAAVRQEVMAAQERKASEETTKFAEFAKEQDKLFTERVPEFADKEKAAKLQAAAVETLTDLGFTEDELPKLWGGQDKLSIRDHRVQMLILDASRYREAKAQVKKAVAKPVPPVQRPGTAAPKGGSNVQLIQNLSAKLEKTGSIKDAAALLVARRAGQK